MEKNKSKNKVNHQPLTHNRNTFILINQCFSFWSLTHNELQNKIIQGETIKNNHLQMHWTAYSRKKLFLYSEFEICMRWWV